MRRSCSSAAAGVRRVATGPSYEPVSRTPRVAEADLERALREVAVLVARGVAPEEVFDAISEQAARVCGVGAGAVVRFTGRAAALVGRWGDLARETLPPGMSFALDGGGAL